jgi:hypothetical protein
MIFSRHGDQPGSRRAWPFLLDVFGGPQSARSVHFIVAVGAVRVPAAAPRAGAAHRPVKHVGEMITGGRLDEAA